MENITGVQSSDLIRDENGQIPIILMTGERDQELRVGFDRFLQEPFTMIELLSEEDRVKSSIVN